MWQPHWESVISAATLPVSADEEAAGVFAPLSLHGPDAILAVSIDRSGVANIDLSPSIRTGTNFTTAAGSQSLIDSLAQTAFQLVDVRAVTFSIEGSCAEFWGSFGAYDCFEVTPSGEMTALDAFAVDAEEGGAAPESVTYTDFWPTSHNGRRVFLSVACHDPDLGPDCVDNFYCGWSENTGSREWSFEATLGTAHNNPGNNNLLERGYAVRIGEGGVNQNIDDSNDWTVIWQKVLHLPMHTNGQGFGSCPEEPPEEDAGTQVLYWSSNGSDAANEFVTTIGNNSPGDDDRKIENNVLQELKPWVVEAVPVYQELEFHSWTKGVNWLKKDNKKAWRIGAAVDKCFGYPRWTTIPYPHVELTGVKKCDFAPSG